MEINDGRAAAEEFASENEDDTDTDDSVEETEQSQNDLLDLAENPTETATQLTDLGPDTETELSKSEQDHPVPKKKARKQKKRRLEEKLEVMSNTLEAMKEFFVKGGYAPNNTGKATPKSKQGGGDREEIDQTRESNQSTSQTMIYHNVLEKVTTGKIDDPEITFKIPIEGNNVQLESDKVRNRESSLSDDQIDTSDEMMEVDQSIHDKFIADCEAEATRRRSKSRDETDRARCEADDIIREAEAGRAQVYAMPGKPNVIVNENLEGLNFSVHQPAAEADENYVMVGSNLDQSLRDKMAKGEYVDFA